eukprot:scaffold83745_cov54-Phaeocystis_antarctica.AAC.2
MARCPAGRARRRRPGRSTRSAHSVAPEQEDGMIARKGESGILQRCTREQDAPRRRQRVEAEPELHMIAAWVHIGLQAVLEAVRLVAHEQREGRRRLEQRGVLLRRLVA